MRYLNQRYAMPWGELKGLLTDIGTEELSHIEMVGTLLYQLTKNLTVDEIKRQGFDKYFVDHTTGVYPVAASGMPWTAATIQSTGDTLADLYENLAAEQKARKTYDNILRLSDDPDVSDVIKFLRAREVVHFQRFGEALQSKCNRFSCIKKRIFSGVSLKYPHRLENGQILQSMLISVSVALIFFIKASQTVLLSSIVSSSHRSR
ncbi:MAG: manganese catalase family protein [Clostridia bacterium]|nr:manganese catalase family protein [Clostridia bacterium]